MKQNNTNDWFSTQTSPLQHVLTYGWKLCRSNALTDNEAIVFAALEANANSVFSFVKDRVTTGKQALTVSEVYNLYTEYCREKLWEAYAGHRFEKLFDQAIADTHLAEIVKTSGKVCETRSTSLYSGLAVELGRSSAGVTIAEVIASEGLWQPDPSYKKNNDNVATHFQPVTNGKGAVLQYGGKDYVPPDLHVTSVRYFEPIPFQSDVERYHFCVIDPLDGVPSPVGYCATGCVGHATEKEAREHYRQFILDCMDRKRSEESLACRVCGTICGDLAILGETIDANGDLSIPAHDLKIPLCPAHLNREIIEQIFRLSNFHELIFY